MSFDLSVADKARWETLVADGRWHALNGSAAAHPIPAGDGWIQVDLFGSKTRGTAILWLRLTTPRWTPRRGHRSAWLAAQVGAFTIRNGS